AEIPLAAVEEILDYRPIDAARTLTKPLLVIGVEDDSTTPTDHAVALYEAARGPRQLILQRHTSHYASYEANGAAIAARIVEWFDRHLVGGRLVIRSRSGAEEATTPCGTGSCCPTSARRPPGTSSSRARGAPRSSASTRSGSAITWSTSRTGRSSA